MKTTVFSVYRDTLNFPNFTPIKKHIQMIAPTIKIFNIVV